MSDSRLLARKLVVYAERRLDLGELDSIYVENVLLRLFGENAPYQGPFDYEPEELPDALYRELEEKLRELSSEDPHKDAVAVFGLLSPRPDEVNRRFHEIHEREGGFAATEYLLGEGRHSGYYAVSDLAKNLRWEAVYPDGSPSLTITINLAKPEKDNKDIASSLKKENLDYPSCALCKENLGYEGMGKIPPRGTLRFVSIELDGDPWYLQYSPYGYFSRHCIAFHHDHFPMKIDGKCFASLLSFVELFPDFFIGSNSDLPIVGGSILTHEHFQGGDKELPLFKAKVRTEVGVESGVRISILDFYDTVLLLEGKEKASLVKTAEKLLAAWRKHVDRSRQFPGVDEDGTNHQTFTPFASREGDFYRLYLILRCNSVSPLHPGGNYHAHEERWAIKKEGIGLIEAAGLFILPSRLKRQLALLEEEAKSDGDFSEIVKENPDLQGFEGCYKALRAGVDVRSYVNMTCRAILDDVAVYKNTVDDQAALLAFVKGALR